MIVYFFKKSKEIIKKWGIVAGVAVVLIYGYFVWTQILLKEHKTLQIIRGQVIESGPISKNDEQVDIEEAQGDYLYVASSRGKYYYPKSCSRAKSLSIKNMLYFKDKMSAEAAGYRAHSAC